MTEAQIRRYARHIVLPEIGGIGQSRLIAARVLVIGAGGLGAPTLQYLAAAGIGTLGVIDDDAVDLSNLQRQILHRTVDIGTSKADSARRALGDLNPEVTVQAHNERLTAANAERILAGYDIVADGSDNFATRYLLNDTCYRLKKILVSAAILRFDGQISTYKAWQGAAHPCLRCLFPAAPSEDAVPSCAQAGVLGALAGTLGAMQATEVVKEILGIGRSLSGRLVTYDALDTSFEEMTITKRADCPTCGHTGSYASRYTSSNTGGTP
jgi:adenylyltransferase/sulfurtransferase